MKIVINHQRYLPKGLKNSNREPTDLLGREAPLRKRPGSTRDSLLSAETFTPIAHPGGAALTSRSYFTSMAFLLNNSISSRLRSHPQMLTPSRGFHVEPGPREQALLADHPALNRYPSLKKAVRTSKKIGNVLTVVVIAGCCYEIYVRATMRDEARKQARQNA